MPEKGFTLIELLITIALVGTLGAIAVMSYQGIVDGLRVRGAARQLFGDMQFARLRAIKEGKEWAVEFTGNSYCIKNKWNGNVNDGAWTAGCTAGAGDTILKSLDISRDYPGVSLRNDYGGVRAEFNPNGTASNFGKVVCNGAKGQEVTVNQNTGNIRIVTAAACP